MQNKLIYNEEAKNNNSVFMSPELSDILNNDNNESDELLLSNIVYVYIETFEDKLIKCIMNLFEKNNNILTLSFSTQNNLSRSIILNRVKSIFIESGEDILIKKTNLNLSNDCKIELIDDSYKYTINIDME